MVDFFITKQTSLHPFDFVRNLFHLLYKYIITEYSFFTLHSHYQLIVVNLPTATLPSQSPDVAFPETNLLTYQEVHYIKSRAVAYIAAEFSDTNFPSNGQFTIGGHGQTSDYPNNRALTPGEYYSFFLRAFPKLATPQKRQTVSSKMRQKYIIANYHHCSQGSSNRQYTVYTSSDYISPIQASKLLSITVTSPLQCLFHSCKYRLHYSRDRPTYLLCYNSSCRIDYSNHSGDYHNHCDDCVSV